MITKDEFELWQAQPVTEQVFKALARMEDNAKERWLRISWDTMDANQAKLVELKAWAEAAKDLRELTFEELEEAMSDDK